MTEQQLFTTLTDAFLQIIRERGLEAEEIHIRSAALTPEQAIGITKRRDYPILTGKEVMLQAEFKGALGQAFTDAPAVFRGTLREVLEADTAENMHNRGLLVASMNAVLRHLGLVGETVHCKEEEPELCAQKAAAWLSGQFGNAKIALVGYQPALLERLSQDFAVRVLDLNPDNVGQERYGVRVEHGNDALQDAVYDWADVVLCTGSCLCNGTLVNFLGLEKPVLFFGTTIAAAAHILQLRRLCFCAA